MTLSKTLMLIGAILFLAGVLIHFAGDSFGWFGHLPGDIRYERDNFKFYMPLTSMILVSVVLSAAIWLVRRFF